MTLVHTVQQQAMTTPTKVAYHFEGQNVSYEQLEQQVGKFAQGLQQQGIERGDHVALLLGNTPHFIISLYAVMRIGATAVPVNPTYTKDEISYILKNAEVKGVIALDVMLPLVEIAASAFPAIKTFILCETTPNIAERVEAMEPNVRNKTQLFQHVLQQANGTAEIANIHEDDTAVILYTSGTTGQPKGAMLTHKNLYSNARDIGVYLNMDENDRVIATLPVFHVFALTVVVNAPLMKGATILLAPRFSPQHIYALAKEQQATIFAGVPTMFNFLLQWQDGDRSDFSHLRLAISGGASLPVALLHAFEEQFNVRISEGYGLSEASPVACFNPLDRERKAGSIGTSIPNVENKIVNEHGEEVAIGEVGELIVRGPNVMKGYYKMPEETALAIRDGWLYTGDLAKQDEEGYFYIVDRKKDLINVGGFNVYPREVEEVIYAHPNVVEAAVVGFPDATFGEAVHAFIVLKEPTTTVDDIVAHCREHLVKYKVPTIIEFIDELPKNSTGKILRRSFKEQVGR